MKMFYVLRQKQSCSHGVKDGCKSLQRFSFKLLKPFCLCLNKALKFLAIIKSWQQSLHFLENVLSITSCRCGFSVPMANPSFNDVLQ